MTSARRSERLADLPTLAESGLADFEVEGWYGMFAPAGNPRVASAWLRERIGLAMAEPATRAELVALGLEPVSVRSSNLLSHQYRVRVMGAGLRASRMPFKNGES